MKSLQQLIETTYEHRGEISPQSIDPQIKTAVLSVIDLLDAGQLRVAEPQNGQWQVNQWVKKAILLYFQVVKSEVMDGGFTQFFDKIPSKYAEYTTEKFTASGVRVVPGACVRQGAYIAPSTVVMPSFVNIGAHIDKGCMIDTWATVGSCAQIGSHVHLSGGAGIGGVLEPLQANPTIIEDHCFIGARSEIVEGVIIGEGSVISMGVFIGQSTRIYDRTTGEITYGRVPPGSVVVSGNLPSSDGKYSLYAAVIVKKVDEQTRKKVSINELLRDL